MRDCLQMQLMLGQQLDNTLLIGGDFFELVSSFFPSSANLSLSKECIFQFYFSYSFPQPAGWGE